MARRVDQATRNFVSFDPRGSHESAVFHVPHSVFRVGYLLSAICYALCASPARMRRYSCQIRPITKMSNTVSTISPAPCV
jgi:hypothetical protein